MPEAASARLGLIAPSISDGVGLLDNQYRAMVAQMEAAVEERATLATYSPNSSTPTYPTPPASPQDGQRWLLRINRYTVTNRHFLPAVWRFRYSTAISRWEYDGGSPWMNSGAAPPNPDVYSSITVNAWYTPSCFLKVPLTGIYIAEWGAQRVLPSLGTAGQTFDVGLGFGAAPAADYYTQMHAAGAGQQVHANMQQAVAITQGTLMATYFRSHAADSVFGGTFLKLTPLYLGALLT